MKLARLCSVLTLTGCVLFAQHEADPEEGQRLFRSNCGLCHGFEGRSLSGIDLLKGKFKKPYTDADLAKLIRSGVPSTAMEGSAIPDAQISDIIAFMRASTKAPVQAQIALGDAARGKAIFEGKGGCTACHRVKGAGSRFGPDLTDIGTLRQPAQLERSVLDPDFEVLPINRVYKITPRSGGTPLNARLLNQDTFTVQLIDSREQLLTFDRSALREMTVLHKSPMPSAKGKLTSAEVADLVGYLASLKGN